MECSPFRLHSPVPKSPREARTRNPESAPFPVQCFLVRPTNNQDRPDLVFVTCTPMHLPVYRLYPSRDCRGQTTCRFIQDAPFRTTRCKVGHAKVRQPSMPRVPYPCKGVQRAVAHNRPHIQLHDPSQLLRPRGAACAHAPHYPTTRKRPSPHTCHQPRGRWQSNGNVHNHCPALMRSTAVTLL